MENVMARVIGGKIKLTQTRKSIVANGNKAFFTVLEALNGAIKILITKANSTKDLNMEVAPLTFKKNVFSTRVSSITT